jgi:hypothetical protein
MTEAARGVAEARDGGKAVGRGHAAYCAALSVIEGGIRFAIPPYGLVRNTGYVTREIVVLVSRMFPLGILFLVLLAPAFAAETSARPTPSSSATKLDQTSLCPSKDFEEFLSAFSERADIQKRYTHLPLQYGEYADISGNRIKWRRIRRMTDIPQFIHETGMVLRSKSQRADKGLNLRIENGDREQLREAAVLFEGGGDIRYYFDLMKDCWYLYAIKDEF